NFLKKSLLTRLGVPRVGRDGMNLTTGHNPLFHECVQICRITLNELPAFVLSLRAIIEADEAIIPLDLGALRILSIIFRKLLPLLLADQLDLRTSHRVVAKDGNCSGLRVCVDARKALLGELVNETRLADLEPSNHGDPVAIRNFCLLE